MADVVDTFYAWLATAQPDDGAHDAEQAPPDPEDVQRYFHGISRARYVIRRTFRMVDEVAKSVGLEPLEHQALIQIFGADQRLRINDVAERLDIPPAFASRLITSLERNGYVQREASTIDRRTTLVTTTAEGQRLLVDIDTQVQQRVAGLQHELTDLDRVTALGIFAFYLGAAPDREHFSRLEQVFQTPDARRRAG